MEPQNSKGVSFAQNPAFDAHAGATLTHSDADLAPPKSTSTKSATIIDVAPGGNPDRELQKIVYPYPEQLATRLKWQFWSMMFLIVAHVFIVGYTDPLISTDISVQVIVVGIQIGMLVIIMLAFFVLTSQTIYVHFGRYDLYVKEYAVLFFLFVVELGLMLGCKIYYLTLFNQNMSPLDFWQNEGFYALWVLQRHFLLAFWAKATYCGFEVFREGSYDPRHVLDR